ncbi:MULTISPECIES: antibiotic biosynthesis monooxygenase family protein [Providencia]|uniref:Antibiotic biosynthesis monooxygenase n=1 Tax=Providencia rettgeri TaxID=587 RepID=A0AB35L863_PRORE|nr:MULTISPECIES: antibiotic biosynthesis monooxygenase [Providencia]AWS50859.1 antibiotic biosynthesis monooxygenase [Providencia rettgeri]EHZ7765117.1 antibiotic biosynthesis monooxygenase [Providencia rettgeri]EIJ7168259.1 antibiotic biosynthesis monooxygenase [Providencia rettgeri]EJD6046349.1 antibiotic biosynthesis monooxygenase [Providencia rettgeri]EJD6477146.1 antibiotic biosynthesis monooxygenase [Providencia rettgeri]
MIAVIFEAIPVPEQKNRYFELAGQLKSELMRIEGFISVERFQSITTEGKILSLSWWETEEAVKNWKKHFMHIEAQVEGQQTIFSHYRIRIANTLKDYSFNKEDNFNV